MARLVTDSGDDGNLQTLIVIFNLTKTLLTLVEAVELSADFLRFDESVRNLKKKVVMTQTWLDNRYIYGVVSFTFRKIKFIN